MTSLRMLPSSLSSQALRLAVIAACMLTLNTFTAAQTPTLIANLPSGASGLISDAAGNLYGTTTGGGNYNCDSTGVGCGTVFELSPAADGSWALTTLYSFNGGTDGEVPAGNVVFDKAGNLYGATVSGGNTSCPYDLGCGTIFKLSPDGSGGWTKRILYRFSGQTDGAHPSGPVIIAGGSSGESLTLYGVASIGGSNGVCCGVAYSLTPQAGAWKFASLHAFTGAVDGFNPLGPLVRDNEGNLFGVAQRGGVTNTPCGPMGCGLIFEIEPTAGGGWKEAVIHKFDGLNGYQPNAGLYLSTSGKLFGTTFGGGINRYGVAFELFRNRYAWKEIAIYEFTGGSDGGSPNSGLVLDRNGHLLGTSTSGLANGCDGTEASCGQVFALMPTDFRWQISAQFPTYLASPSTSGLFLDKSGNIFGTATDSGDGDFGGAAYEIIP
jgi:hypothetical protein